MDYENRFSKKAKKITASEIREILKIVKNGNVISMAGGLPNPKTFPVKTVNRLASKALEEEGSGMLQYGTTMGNEELRKKIAHRINKKFNTSLDLEQILITAGSQQGLFLMGRAFIDESDKVVVSGPTYLAALTAFNNFSPKYVEIPLDENGMKTDLLEERLKEGLNIKYAYTVPTFQNPTGVTMSASRRKELLRLAEKYDFLVIEDSPYNELRYQGSEINPIISMKSDRVLFLGTFSKILAPGFRIGWVAGNKKLIRKLEIIKQSIDLCTNTFSQKIIQRYLNTGKIEEQIKKIKDIYGSKRELLLKALDEYMPEVVKWTRPKGGMFIWLTLPSEIDTENMFKKALENEIAYVPGHTFYANDEEKNTLRLNFTFVDDTDIEMGIKRLATTINNELDNE